ncbi:MAG: ABC transporter ATP-binding protein [Acidobacteriota bacterium]|jgi:lipoprotein-releasing system ATP-binding protein|nr:ABC transporter ATP-binding protein [Acidobacteriota bacterium]
MSDLLEVRDLQKSYVSGGGRLEILSGLSLKVREGEMLGITGVSGSGKSTLLHLLGGMDRQDGGSIKIAGQEIVDLAPAELADFRNRTVGFIFQAHHLLPEFTALENVMMPLLLRGEAKPVAAKAAGELLDEVGLAGRASHRPGEMSGGEQQRTALARALAGKPRLLLADEPTGNLDPHTGEVIAELLRSLHAGRNLTSIIVTHNESLAAVCTRVLRMENGRLADSRAVSITK